jgi:hypothetical protein
MRIRIEETQRAIVQQDLLMAVRGRNRDGIARGVTNISPAVRSSRLAKAARQ